METLKQDPRALEIFIDEMALADLGANRHQRFLNYGQKLGAESRNKGGFSRTMIGSRNSGFRNAHKTFDQKAEPVGNKVRKWDVIPKNGVIQHTGFGTNY